ncbi:hypothetical protein JOC78_001954 [Bacillus ectoiniformans]|uniref:hypothetical protein n=1 Tax=Bacillus ectoiniformans TaxID=1494429 RepID=UPI001955F753|nr:hypothetical protein [Bacillus ectoiniformans]MBM7649004.1 hypothetical protein [Bacillus ectoiniformans]
MFKGLLIKDYLLIKNYMWGWLAAVLAIYAAGISLIMYNDVLEVMFPFVLFLYFLHTILLPVTGMILLKAEEKGQYWLHGTANGWKLLLSKLLISCLVFFVSLLLMDVLALISANISFPKELMNGNRLPFSEGFFLNGAIFIGALYFTMWGLFFWAFYHSLNGRPALKKIRWLLIGAIYFSVSYIASQLTKLPLFQNWFAAWTVDIVDARDASTQSFGGPGLSFSIENGGLQVWPLLLAIVFQAFLFLAASWMLDRKVEV